MDRTVKADLLQSKGLNFVKCWVDATGGTGNVYLHLLDKEVDEDFAEELVVSEEERKSDEQSEASAPVEAEQSSSTFSATDED